MLMRKVVKFIGIASPNDKLILIHIINFTVWNILVQADRITYDKYTVKVKDLDD